MNNQENIAIMNAGTMPNSKQNTNIRVLSLNVKEFNTTNKEKLYHLITECQKREIDMALLNKMNTKWTSVIKSSMKYKLSSLDKNVEVLFADSDEHKMTKNNWLQGGLMNAIWSTLLQYFDRESVYNDKLGRWVAFKLTNKLKTILFIAVYRIPNSIGGVYLALQ